MKVTIMAFIVSAAMSELAPIPLPGPHDCPSGTPPIHLDARPYFQKGERYGYGCSIIGQPGTTIVGGLHWSSGFPLLGGSIHFDGGDISSQTMTVAISGENMSFTGCSLSSGMGVSFSGHVSITDSSVLVDYGRGVHIHDATISLANTSLGGSDDGYFEMSNSTATMVDVQVSQVTAADFYDSRLTVKGLHSWFHGQTDFQSMVKFYLLFVNTSATFQHGTDVITSDDVYGNGVSVTARNHSSVTFRNCTSLARAIHNSTTKGDVVATADSLISCTPSEMTFVV
jgi:hypothetical protein